MPWLAVLPAINAFACSRNGVGPFAVPLMIGLVLAYGAGVTSLGLACATWVRRFGRAVAAGVALYGAGERPGGRVILAPDLADGPGGEHDATGRRFYRR